MSRHPSPGPSTQHPHQPPSVSSRQKQPKSYAVGIAAGAEDVKYQTKYKELKRKVKDIESDNDKLHYKLLQAKRSIQRMKVERAILYERLSPPPETHDRHTFQQMQHPVQTLPYPQPIRGHPVNVQLHEIRDHPPSGDDHAIGEYMRSQANSRGPPPSDAQHLQSMDYPIGPGVSSIAHSPRRTASGHDTPRPLPPLQQLPSMPIEIPRTQSLPPSHTSPLIHHSHVPSSNERSRPHHSHSRGHQPPQSYMQTQTQPSYSDSRSTTHHVHSPPLSERERSRRHDVHEMNEPHNLVRHQTPGAQQSPSLHSADTRSVSRMHNHQPMGSGVYMGREEQHDRQQDSEREREWERNRDISRNREFSSSRMQSPPLLHRSRSVLERGEHSEHPLTPRIREDPDYYHGISRANYLIHQRPDSASSRSGSGDGQRSENPHYDSEHSRTYRLRPVTQDDVGYVHHDNSRAQNRESGGGGGGGGNIPPPPPEPTRGSAESTRKRNRNEMDVDSDPETELAENIIGRGGAGNSGYIRRNPGDRGVKRYHMPRNVESQEDSRMGPP